MSLLKRKPTRSRSWRLFFATDVHGSEQCFRKWLNAGKVYEADVLVLGGDVTGKALVPIVEEGGDVWRAALHGQELEIHGSGDLEAFRGDLAKSGYYARVVGPAEKAELDADPEVREAAFREAMGETLERWSGLAEERLGGSGISAYAMLGNDDEPELAEILRAAPMIEYAEDGIFLLPEGVELLSFGYSTPTPWHTPRELEEEEIAARIAERVASLIDPSRAIFNLHCPPRDTQLDQAPKLDEQMRPVSGPGGAEMVSVGSAAVREVIEQMQPRVGLHGHVHESPAAQTVASTICVNPGSEYPDGMLRGVLVDFYADEGEPSWQMVKG